MLTIVYGNNIKFLEELHDYTKLDSTLTTPSSSNGIRLKFRLIRGNREQTLIFLEEKGREKFVFVEDSLTRAFSSSGIISRISDNDLSFPLPFVPIIPRPSSLLYFFIIVPEFSRCSLPVPSFVPLEIGRHLADGDSAVAANDSRTETWKSENEKTIRQRSSLYRGDAKSNESRSLLSRESENGGKFQGKFRRCWSTIDPPRACREILQFPCSSDTGLVLSEIRNAGIVERTILARDAPKRGRSSKIDIQLPSGVRCGSQFNPRNCSFEAVSSRALYLLLASELLVIIFLP